MRKTVTEIRTYWVENLGDVAQVEVHTEIYPGLEHLRVHRAITPWHLTDRPEVLTNQFHLFETEWEACQSALRTLNNAIGRKKHDLLRLEELLGEMEQRTAQLVPQED